jgi:arylsulfatase A-like enzyme
MYEAEVRYVDEEIGRFLSELKDDGIYDELLLVFTSDHGEEFWEHYGYSHGHAMYDEVVHIPMMVKLPGNSPTGRVSARVSNGALMETVLDLCGLQYTSQCYDPPSLSNYLTAANGEPANATLSPTGTIFIEPQETLLLDDYKYLHWLSTGRESVFDLRTDPGEKRPLQYDRPELVEEMRAELEAIRERENEVRSCFGPTDVEATPGEDLQRRLRSIGYIQ